jgi:hypothetical protein
MACVFECGESNTTEYTYHFAGQSVTFHACTACDFRARLTLALQESRTCIPSALEDACELATPVIKPKKVDYALLPSKPKVDQDKYQPRVKAHIAQYPEGCNLRTLYKRFPKSKLEPVLAALVASGELILSMGSGKRGPKSKVYRVQE